MSLSSKKWALCLQETFLTTVMTAKVLSAPECDINVISCHLFWQKIKLHLLCLSHTTFFTLISISFQMEDYHKLKSSFIAMSFHECVYLNVKHSAEQSSSQQYRFKDNWIRGHLMHSPLTQDRYTGAEESRSQTEFVHIHHFKAVWIFDSEGVICCLHLPSPRR